MHLSYSNAVFDLKDFVIRFVIIHQQNLLPYTIWIKVSRHPVVWKLDCLETNINMTVLLLHQWYPAHVGKVLKASFWQVDFQASITAEVSAGSGDGQSGWIPDLRSYSFQKCSTRFRSGLWEGQTSFWTPLSLNRCCASLGVGMAQLTCWKRNGLSLKYWDWVGRAVLSWMYTYISQSSYF